MRLEDIAAALSKVCRFGAQATRFHSVAQHAVLVMRFTVDVLDRPDLALWALHHDSHEAYTCDIPRPLKLKIRDSGNTTYDDICESLDSAIARSLGVQRAPKQSSDAGVIDRADDMALIVEARSLLANGDAGVVPKTVFTSDDMSALPPLGRSLTSQQAESAFLSAHSHAATLPATVERRSSG